MKFAAIAILATIGATLVIWAYNQLTFVPWDGPEHSLILHSEDAVPQTLVDDIMERYPQFHSSHFQAVMSPHENAGPSVYSIYYSLPAALGISLFLLLQLAFKKMTANKASPSNSLHTSSSTLE